MKKTFVTLMALAGMVMADTTLLDMDFTELTGNSNDNLPADWTAGHYGFPNQGDNDNAPHYNFDVNGAVVARSGENHLSTELEIDSMGEYNINFTLFGKTLFFLSSDTYSVFVGNDGAEFYVGSYPDAVIDHWFEPPLVGDSSHPIVTPRGEVSCALTMRGGVMSVKTNFWESGITGMEDVTFDRIGIVNINDEGNAGVKYITVTTPKTLIVPEPTTATLSLLALCGLAARRRRK